MATILIVDDHPTNREFLVTLLGYQGHRMLEASDGAQALAVVRAERPNLVITDILMPTMDGYEFVRQLRADPRIAATPVVFYTAHYRKQEAERLARSSGVGHILVKPCEPELILHTVQEAFGTPLQITPLWPPESFHEQHLRVVTDKLSKTADQLTVTNQRLAALIDISLQLASERDPKRMLENVCRAARDVICAKYAAIGVTNKENTDVAYFTTSGIEAGVATSLSMPRLDTGIFSDVLTARRARRIARTGGDPGIVGLPRDHPQVHSALVAPIVSLSSVYGWICLSNKLGADAFDQEDEELLSILSAQTGRIYENGSLYARLQAHAAQLVTEVSERKEAERKIRRLNRVYAVLSGINSLIVRVRERDELFRESCRIAVELGRFQIAWIGVVDRSAMKIVPIASAGAGAEFLTLIKDRFPLREDAQFGNTPSARAVREKKSIVSNDTRDDPTIVFASERVGRGIASMAVLPLLVENDAAGVLALYADESGFFDDEEMKLLTELAGDIGFALDHIEKAERLHYLAYYDEITGLPNRTLFLERIGRQLRAHDGGKNMLALALVDIERFRIINDTFGRQAGDELLKLVAQRIQLGEIGLETAARIGVDCFGVAVREAHDAQSVALALEQLLRACFAKPFRLRGSDLRIAGKAGIALYPLDGGDAETLLRNAEAALKRAKSSAESLLFYAPEMNLRVAEALNLESRLRTAIETDQFVLHYQPKVNLANGKLSGAEALIRWNDPQSGLVAPGHFTPLLEETGLIYEVGRWALRQAIEDYLRWRAAGLAAVRIAVNVSPRQLRHRGFIAEIKQAIGIDAQAAAGLELELTESLIMDDVKHSIACLQAIRAMGVSIAIDDFGTGFSSLSYLAKLPVDTLKIDRSFVLDMTTGPEGLALVSTIITLAHSLKLKVVAEGVETEAQSHLLRLLNCDEMQGYLFSKPLPGALFETRHLAPLAAAG